MSSEPFETLEAQGYPSVTQLSVFIDDRVGQLMRLTRVFAGTDIRILGLMVVNSVDCAIVRMIVDDPDAAGRVLADHSFPYKETEMLVVCLPHGKRGLMDVWSAMLGAEIDVHYTYALLGDPHGNRTIAVHTDNIEMAVESLRKDDFVVLDQMDLQMGQ
ncbi:MAG: acetolactate synthase [Planctomycetes bacterium]|nr:acetolactate synthase [Planctomycetota bacterium]